VVPNGRIVRACTRAAIAWSFNSAGGIAGSRLSCGQILVSARRILVAGKLRSAHRQSAAIAFEAVGADSAARRSFRFTDSYLADFSF
jgi:hypothetical protein